NDLADEAIDRVNLPGDRRRPLVTGAAARAQLVGVGGTSAAIALGAAAMLGGPPLGVTAAGVAGSAGDSRRPVRLGAPGARAAPAWGRWCCRPATSRCPTWSACSPPARRSGRQT